MKHSVQELVATAYEYFPRGIPSADPHYEQTPEVLRQKGARVPASARYEDWRAMLRRLRGHFPEERFPEVKVHNQSLFLQVPTAAVHLDRCYTGELWLPARAPEEEQHKLIFLVSFVVPYYVICSSHIVDDPETTEVLRASQAQNVCVFVHDTCFMLPASVVKPEILAEQKPLVATREVRRFDLSSDELPFAKAIGEEIATTFPGHEPIPPELGLTVVPDVQAGNRWFGEATIFTCLFSDSW